MSNKSTSAQRKYLSKPRLFIIESLRLDDETDNLFEGRLIRDILRLSGSESHYVYIRTEAELLEMLDRFEDSGYRYLHFSCHGNSKSIGLTLDSLSFPKLAKLLRPVLRKRRVFFSACDVVNESLARALLPGSTCYSLVGPSQPIAFDRAAIFWASFYHRMLRDEAKSMKRDAIREATSILQYAFGVQIRYFQASSGSRGYAKVPLHTVSLSNG